MCPSPFSQSKSNYVSPVRPYLANMFPLLAYVNMSSLFLLRYPNTEKLLFCLGTCISAGPNGEKCGIKKFFFDVICCVGKMACFVVVQARFAPACWWLDGYSSAWRGRSWKIGERRVIMSCLGGKLIELGEGQFAAEMAGAGKKGVNSINIRGVV
jgi:hypothetical protein